MSLLQPTTSSHCLLLPPELLSEIFTFAAGSDPPTRTHLGWLVLGHICARLRDVLLSQHILWGRVVSVFPRGQKEIARRAADAPLWLGLSNLHERVSDDTVQFTMVHLSRAALVSIEEYSVGQRLWTPTPASLSGLFLPRLQTLTVKTLKPWMGVPDGGDGSSTFNCAIYDLPPIIAPLLRRIHLENNFVPFDPAKLTHLTLRATKRGQSPVDAFLPTEAQFMRMLRQCGGLEELRLYSWVPDLSDAPTYAEESVALPRLRKLYVWGPLARCATLLSRLQIPPMATLDVSLDNLALDAHDPSLPLVNPAAYPPYADPRRYDLITRLAGDAAERSTGLCIVLEPSMSQVRFVLFTTEEGSGTRKQVLDLEFYRWVMGRGELRSAMGSLCSSIDVFRLVRLEVLCGSAALSDATPWRELLVPFQCVREAAFCFWDSVEAESLVAEIVEPDEPSSTTVVFPVLQALRFIHGHASLYHGPKEGGNRRLSGALVKRKEMGRGVVNLI